MVKVLGKTIRAMSDGTIDSQLRARIANALGIMLACLETVKLEQLEAELAELKAEAGRRQELEAEPARL